MSLPAANGGPATIGVLGPDRVVATLRGEREVLEAEVTVEHVGSTSSPKPETVDCVVAAARSAEQRPEGQPEDADQRGAEAVTDGNTDVLDRATALADRETAPPVVLLAPSERAVVEALEAGVTEYLPLATVERAPATVLRRAADAAASAGTADYRTVYDNVSEPLTLHDPETGELVHANRRMCELVGYDRAELIEMRVADYTADIDGYDQAAAMDIITSAKKEGVVGPVEWPLETAGGEQVWVEATLTPIEVRGRELILSTATDVTDRRRQRRQLREITEHIDEVVYLARADLSEVLFVNSAYAELFGQPVERVYDHPLAVLEAVHPEDRAAYREDLTAMSNHVRSGADEPYEFSHRLRVGGETRWVEVTGYPSSGPGGDVDRIVGVVRDVTDARRREREYEQIFNGVNDAIAVHDPDTGEIVDVNDSYLDLLGYDRRTIVEGDMNRPSVTEEGYTDERARELITSVAESGTDRTVEWLAETADGDRRTLEANLTVAEVGGRRRVLSIVRDVTERRRRQKDYERIFHGANDVITIHDPETGEYVDINDTLCELTGFDRETILEGGIDRVSATEDGYTAQRAKAFIREVVETGEPKTTEWKVRTADGEARWLEVNGSVATIGGESRYISMAREITEQKRRQREYEQIFHGVNDAIAVFDPESVTFVDVNDSYRDLLGYEDLDRIRELGIEGLSAVEDGYTAQRGRELVREVARTGEPRTVEWKAKRRDGQSVWLEVTLATAEIGGEQRVLSIQRDITERRQREQEFQQVFNGVTDVIGVYDPETTELLDVNETMCDLLGYDRETILEMEPAEVTATELGFDAERIGTVVREVAETGDPATDIEWALRTANGDTVWLEVNATLAEIGGERRVLTIARDVTGRRDREERVQVLNRVLRHNVRNDMDAVMAYATAIEEMAGSGRVAEHGRAVRDTAEELLELSEKARAAERTLRDDDRREVRPLGTVLESVVTDAREDYERATIDLVCEGTDAPVEADIFRLVVAEILENAAEHGGVTPTVEVCATPGDEDGGGPTVTITDDGPGIPDSVLLPFRSSGETQYRHNHGLGLWLIKWGIRRLGGGIDLDRASGGGSVVRLQLPDRTE